MASSVSGSAPASKVQQPEWIPPTSELPEPVLQVWNSLTKSKVEFVAQRSRQITWYNCGPTVYDASHMGHARNYVTQDVLRRIMRDYFGYDIHFVQNVTDIDDKIILRSRQEHLLNELVSSTSALTPQLLQDARTAWTLFYRKNLPKSLAPEELGPDGAEETTWDDSLAPKKSEEAWKKAGEAKEEKFGMYLSTLTSSREAIQSAAARLERGETGVESARSLIDGASDPLSAWLDKQFGHSITSPSISRNLTSRWEAAFSSDMAKLNVLPPDTITRVTEYVPEVVEFVQRIVDKGFGYADQDGSVWFDVAAFDGRKKQAGGEAEDEWEHVYAKLAPWSKGNTRLLEEGEGSLTAPTSSKRSPADFVLWKASKPGEPRWNSPWGEGRPGWHIECSVMATEILGQTLDIHSGGVDLMFPHHDNEVAQAEAYHDCRQWVNYFFHTGHLHIEGLKMSKSLKNFITIDQALERYSARQLRLGFLLQQWNSKMDFKESAMAEAKGLESSFNNLFALIKARTMQAPAPNAQDAQHYYDGEEKRLSKELQTSQHAFRVALSDSFDTPRALQVLAELTNKTNVYLQLKRPNLSVAVVVAEWIGSMLKMLGLGTVGDASKTLGWGASQTKEDESGDREQVLMPYLSALSTFRDQVRKLAIAKADPSEILALTDRLRDYELAELGVALDDQADGRALVKLVPAATLIEARETKLAYAAQKASQAAASKAAARDKLVSKMTKLGVPASDMFRPPHVAEGTYSGWDERGVPTLDGEGVELSKGKVKKVLKEWEAQVKGNEEYKKWKADEDQAGRSA